MSIVEIKEEIKSLEVADLDEVAALILQLGAGKILKEKSS